MDILEVTELNEDGSVKFVAYLPKEEVQHLLRFALNLSASVGLGAHKRYMAHKVKDADDNPEFEGNPGLNA